MIREIKTKGLRMLDSAKKGFTLAEVLITLVIIGIISALTLKIIFASTDDRDVVAKVKKTYSMFCQLMMYAQAKGGDFDMVVSDGNDAIMNQWFNEYLKPGLNYTKICYNSAGCWNPGDTYGLNGTKVPYSKKGGIGGNTISAVLMDGTLILIDGFESPDMHEKFGVNTHGKAGLGIYFDTNGPKKPNTLGKDVFVMIYVTGKGMTVPYDNVEPDDCKPNQIGYSCIKQFLKK